MVSKTTGEFAASEAAKLGNLAHSDHSDEVIRIAPSRGWVSLKLREVWQYRELLYFLIWRDIKVRYKQTALGAVWAILQPVLNTLMFAFLFGKVGKMPSDGYPHIIFIYAGMVPWTFFAFGLGQSANSLVGSANLITKVYFPRLTIPIAAVLSGIVDFALAFAILLILMPFYGIWPTVNVIWLPFLLLLALVASLGVGLWLSALNVQYRDIRYIVPFLTTFWMLATPVAWASSAMRPEYRALLGLNPMSGVVEGFRWALLGTPNPPVLTLVVSTVVALLLLVSGAFYFRRMEKTFADLV